MFGVVECLVELRRQTASGGAVAVACRRRLADADGARNASAPWRRQLSDGSCDAEGDDEEVDDGGCASCGNIGDYAAWQFLSLLIVVLFTIGLPAQMYVLIKKSVPVGSTEDPEHRFDHEGNKVPYDEIMYQEDLEKPRNAKNPYINLFKDYEKKWKYYEIIVMLFKLLLLFPLVLLAAYPSGQAAVTGLIVFASLQVSRKAAPFPDDLADQADQVAKLSETTTIGIGLCIAALGPCTGGGTVLFILLNLVSGVSSIAEAYTSRWAPTSPPILKNYSKKATFKNRITRATGECAHRPDVDDARVQERAARLLERRQQGVRRGGGRAEALRRDEGDRPRQGSAATRRTTRRPRRSGRRGSRSRASSRGSTCTSTTSTPRPSGCKKLFKAGCRTPRPWCTTTRRHDVRVRRRGARAHDQRQPHAGRRGERQLRGDKQLDLSNTTVHHEFDHRRSGTCRTASTSRTSRTPRATSPDRRRCRTCGSTCRSTTTATSASARRATPGPSAAAATGTRATASSRRQLQRRPRPDHRPRCVRAVGGARHQRSRRERLPTRVRLTCSPRSTRASSPTCFDLGRYDWTASLPQAAVRAPPAQPRRPQRRRRDRGVREPVHQPRRANARVRRRPRRDGT